MAIIPSRNEISKFFDHHPILGTVFFVAGAFTAFETVRAVTAPKGKGPFSNMGGLGGSTSTTTSSGTSHRGFRRTLTQDVIAPRSIAHTDFFGIPTQALANLGSANLPPAMRRRVSQRAVATPSLGASGAQSFDVEDNMARSGYSSMADLYGMDGIVPQPGGGWTE